MRRITRTPLFLLPALTVLAILAGWSLISGAATHDRDDGTSALGEPPPGRAVDEEELDRLIDVLATRAPARSESLDFRFLGSLLLERATLNADVADYRSAVDAFTAALDLAPDEPAALLGVGQASLGIHDFERAETAAARLVQLDPTNPDARALSVDAAVATGDVAAAVTHLERLVELRSGDPAITIRRAQVALLTTGRDAAIAAAVEAVDQSTARGQTAPELAFYLSHLGRLAFDQGDHEIAAERLERAVDLAPTDHGILGELARVRAATGRTEEAIELLGRANALIPEPDHLFLQADLEELLGRGEAAEADRARGLSLATVDDDHRRAWARALADHHLDGHGDAEAALRIAEAELAVRDDAGAWDLLAWSHYHTGDLDQAASASARALEIGPPDARIAYHAAVIADAQGRTDDAVALLRQALDLNPGFDPIDAPAAADLLDRLT